MLSFLDLPTIKCEEPYHLGRYKYYIVMWTVDTLNKLPSFRPYTAWGEKGDKESAVVAPPKPAPVVVESPEEQKKNSKPTTALVSPPKIVPRVERPTTEQLLADHEATWKEKHACLDGNSGRPSVRDCVIEAMNHTARHKCDDLKIYVDGWLRSAAQKYKYDFQQEEALHWSDPKLSPELQKKKREAEDERRKAYEERQQRRFEEWAASQRCEPSEDIKQRTAVFLATIEREKAFERRRMLAAY